MKFDTLQVNTVAFIVNNEIPIGSTSLPAGKPWVTSSTETNVMQEFDGWADDVIGLLRCMQTSSKWSIHVVYPPLESYVKGRVALIGDAVSAYTMKSMNCH